MLDFLNIKSLLFDIKFKIPEHDRKIFSNIDNYIVVSTRDYIESIIPENYHFFKVAVLPIENYYAKVPSDFKRLVQVAANGGQYHNNRGRSTWMSEIVGHIEKHNDCVAVYQKKCKCGDVCSCDIVLTDREFDHGINSIGHTLMNGSRFDLIHYRQRYHTEEDGCYGSLIDRRFYICSPSQSNLFGMKQQNIYNHSLKGDLVGNQYEYKVLRPGYITTNIERGVMLLSYYGLYSDEPELVSFPNLPSVMEVIKAKARMEIYDYLRAYHTGPHFNTYERLFQSITQEYLSKVQDARDDLYKIRYDELVKVLLKAKYGNKVIKTYNTIIQPDSVDFVRDMQQLKK